MKLYTIYQDGHRISEPRTLEYIIKCWGPVAEIEAAGFRLVPYTKSV